jgi:hypothetical protein
LYFNKIVRKACHFQPAVCSWQLAVQFSVFQSLVD